MSHHFEFVEPTVPGDAPRWEAVVLGPTGNGKTLLGCSILETVISRSSDSAL